jgi:hypothetical protein
MTNVIDITPALKAKEFWAKRYNEACQLFDKYKNQADKFSQTKASFYCDAMVKAGDMLDQKGGAL